MKNKNIHIWASEGGEGGATIAHSSMSFGERKYIVPKDPSEPCFRPGFSTPLGSKASKRLRAELNRHLMED